MQRILILFVIAALTGISTHIAWAAPSTTVVTAQKDADRRISTITWGMAATTPNVGVTAAVTPTASTGSTLKAPAVPVTSTVAITRLKPITAQVILSMPTTKTALITPTIQSAATALPTAPQVTTPLPSPTPDPAAADAAYTDAITGTIIANRTEAKVRFFVEGATYNLDPLRSLGLTLPRATAVLNLYNCDAGTPESKDCFWDPYLLDKDSFYEIVKGADVGKTVNLSLRQAGTPPADRVWVQNRTGKRETIFYNENVYDIPPSSVQEFTVEQNAPTILLHLRDCITVNGKSACEWSPRNAEPGYYYALVETSMPGQAKDSTVSNLALQFILGPEGKTPSQTITTTTPATPTIPTTAAPAIPGVITCRLQVPIINIRSGPGLQYQVIGKVASSGQEPGTVNVVGRDATQQWVAVEDQVAPGGWMTASPGFMECNGDLTALPVAQVTDGRLEPTPPPQVVAEPAASGGTEPATNTASQTPTQTEQSNITPTVAAPSVGPGQALLIVNNGFDQPIRFTLDQVYRIEQGPSEFDLQPGQGINILVHPGQVAFSASSAWRSLAGNKEFFLDNQATRVMWITFIPDPDESGNWILQF